MENERGKDFLETFPSTLVDESEGATADAKRRIYRPLRLFTSIVIILLFILVLFIIVKSLTDRESSSPRTSSPPVYNTTFSSESNKGTNIESTYPSGNILWEKGFGSARFEPRDAKGTKAEGTYIEFFDDNTFYGRFFVHEAEPYLGLEETWGGVAGKWRKDGNTLTLFFTMMGCESGTQMRIAGNTLIDEKGAVWIKVY